jgi:hypothetical protein
MARGQSTETQVNLKINGKEASDTIKGMTSDVKTLRRELQALPVDSDAFKNKAKELAVAEDRLIAARNAAAGARQQMQALGDTAKNARADLLSLSPFGQQLQGFTSGLSSVRAGVMANIQSMGLLRVAIAATGIGALVLAVISLVHWFTKTDEGAKLLEGSMNALSNIVDVLMDRMRKLLTGDFSGAVENLGEDLEQATRAGFELAEVMDQIDEKQRALSLESAKEETRLAQLLLQAKNRTLTDKARIDLLAEASKTEERVHSRKMEMANDELRAIQMEIEQKTKSGTLTDELAQKETDALIKIENLKTESISLQEKINNRQAALEDEINAERLKKAEEAKKRREKLIEEEAKLQEEKLKKDLELARRLSDLQIANIQDEGERKKVAILENHKRALEDAFVQGIQTKELELELLKQRDAALLALENELKEKKKAQDQKDRDAAAKEKQDILSLEIEQQLALADQARLTEIEREQTIYQIRRNGLEQRMELLRQEGKDQGFEFRRMQIELTKLDLEHNKKREEITARTYDTEAKLQASRLQLFSDTTKGISAFLTEDANNRRRFAGIVKAMTIAEIATMGIKEVQGIWTNANINALNAIIPGWGPAFAAVQSALAIGRTTFAVTNAAGVNFFQDGGILRTGSRHRDGGIKMIDGKSGQYLGEVEQGEALHVYSRKTVENNGDIINALLDTSMFRGGARLKSNRPGFYENGGVVSSGSGNSPSANSNEALVAMQLEKLDRIASILESWPDNVRAILTYEQTAKMLNEAADIEAGANAA